MDNKEQQKQKTSGAALIWRFLRGSKRYFAVAVVSAAVGSLAEMINPQIIRVALDHVIGSAPLDSLSELGRALIARAGGVGWLRENLWAMALAIVCVAFFGVIGQYLFRVCNTKGAETLVKTMRDRLYAHIARLPFGWHMKNRTGDIIQRCTSDIDTLKRFVSEQLTSVFRITILLILSMIFMIGMDPLLALIALVPTPFIIAYSMRFHRKIGKGFLDCDENEGKLSAMAQENLTGVRVVRAFGRERYEKDRFEAHNEYYTGLWVKLSRVMSTYWSSADVFSGLQVMLVVVFGAVFCIRGRMIPGEYVAFLSYNQLLVWPIRMLGRMISEMSKAGVSMERIAYIMDSEEERDEPDAVDADMSGDIRFEHVNFGYEGSPQMLFDIDFTLPAGTTLGILGGTGSGKSTMMALLDKLYPIEEGKGRITIGGVDIRRIRTGHLRRSIGMVLQEPYLFSRTLEENIAITRPKLSREEVREAARAACLDETIESFAKGYETFVGERGVTLSGGQKQRAAIARTLTQNTPIMIFDDSLSAVDTETDAKIRAALQKRFGTASVILISHRITTLSKADQILVLERGRIVERGSHDELKKAGGIYQKIYEIQSGAGEEAAV
ncbi:MAG: ABC transporter ATP-binding protein/permease [Oscillospiraceae bacterium]|nr:ABC transporter ATP-binding protein/permease [Oscillospiraceae bacterium]